MYERVIFAMAGTSLEVRPGGAGPSPRYLLFADSAAIIQVLRWTSFHLQVDTLYSIAILSTEYRTLQYNMDMIRCSICLL